MTTGIAVVGMGWMGHAHTRAYLRLRHHYPALSPVELVAAADPEPGRAAEAARRYGFAVATEDWTGVLDDPRVTAVSVTAPNFLHREIGVAVAAAGRHLWIEKPVGLSAADARDVAAAVAGSGVRCTVGFNYRNAPAVAEARRLIRDGAVGEPTHARVRLFSDYAAHPQGALSWRFERARGGDGVLGDLASHGVDLARYLIGEIDALIADTAVVVPRRPRATGGGSHFARAENGELGEVENADYVSCLLRFAGGARGVLEASRVDVGEQNTYGFEIHGTRGLVAWDFRRLGELSVSTGDGYLDQRVQTVFVGPEQGEYGAFQPGAGIAMSYDDLKVIEAYRFLSGAAGGAGAADAVASAYALEAMSRSVEAGGWVRVAR